MNDPDPTEPAPQRRALAERALVAACVLGIAFLLGQIVLFGYGRDQGIYAMVGRAVAAGRMPYRDAWDFKPPGIFLVYALSRAVFGGAQRGIRLVEAAGLVAMTVAMVRLTARWWGDRRVGLVAGAISILVHAQLEFWHTAQPESFGGMLTIFALLALGPLGPLGPLDDRAPDRATLRRWALCGAIFGFTGLLKPPLAGGGAVVAVALGLRALGAHAGSPIVPRLRAALLPAACIAAGGAAPIVLCALWFLARGAHREMWDVLFVFTPHYTRLSWVGQTLTGMIYNGFTDWLTAYCSVPTVGFLLCLAFSPRPRERFGAALIAGIIAVYLAGVIMQGKFFPYHYGAVWPLTSLLAALGFVRAWDWLAARGPLGPPVFFAGFAFVAFFRTATTDLEHAFSARCAERMALYAASPRDQAAIDRMASVADVNAVANRAVADFLRARVPADRKVFVWGFEPVIYDLADRAPATRYLYDVPQRVAWAKDKERATLMADLDAGRPAAVVVERRDVFPMVTGDAIDSADTLKGFDALRDRLAERYALATTIEDFDVYLER